MKHLAPKFNMVSLGLPDSGSLSWPRNSVETNVQVSSLKWANTSMDFILDSFTISTTKKLCREGRLIEAIRILDIIPIEDSKVYPEIYIYLLKTCTRLRALDVGRHVDAHIRKSSYRHNTVLSNILINMYVKCCSTVDACRVFYQMQEKNLIAWTSMISMYSRSHENAKDAIKLFKQMHMKGIRPDKVSFICALNACANIAALGQGKLLHAHCITSIGMSDIFVENALVDMYGKCGNIGNAYEVYNRMLAHDVVSGNAMILVCIQDDKSMHNARTLFDSMSERSVVSWNIMIAGYVQNGDSKEALKLFVHMQEEGTEPDKVTFLSVVQACATLAALDYGKLIHNYIFDMGLDSDTYLANALVNMYARCGSMEYASRVFENLPNKDLFAWTAMITGYSLQGNANDCLNLFVEMHKRGLKPDKITFTNFLSACSHAGLLHEGYHYFNVMSRYYCLIPVGEDYACMVDTLGRAGHLDQAHHFIISMPLQPSVMVWMALLSACEVYGAVHLAERAAQHILQLDPQNLAALVLLSNTYAAAGMWKDKAETRKRMEGIR